MYTTHTSDGCAKSQMDNIDPVFYARFQMLIELYASQIIMVFLYFGIAHFKKEPTLC